MVEEKVEPREVPWRQRLPWTEIFQGFRIALDFNKLLLAAAGILCMAIGWWLLAVVFYYDEPQFGDKKYAEGNFAGESVAERKDQAWRTFKSDRQKWDLMHAAAGPSDPEVKRDAGDIADSWQEHTALTELDKNGDKPKTLEDLRKREPPISDSAIESARQKLPLVKDKDRPSKKSGNLRTLPWCEPRGPNPYLMLTGQTTAWERGGFWDWLLNIEVPVLLEPLVKMVRPVVLFFHPHAGFVNSLYFLLVLLVTVVTWAFFGGAITRIAAVQVARQEKLTLPEAIRFTTKRWVSFVTAPLFPILFVFILLVFMVIFGFFHMIPWVGDIFVDGIFWPVMLIFGLLMAVALVGLIGWPLMSSTVSTEGTDSWEAVSRSYSYVFQAPWNYLAYWLLALAYGAVLILFVGFMGSFTVYLSKWGVSQTPWVQKANRDPSYLFVYAPTSFGWRNLLLKSVQLQDGTTVVNQETGEIIPENYAKYIGSDEEYTKNHKSDTLSWWNKIGAGMVAFWLGLFFLLILGFGYSYFWSVSAIIYLLMRKKVDDAEIDEVYLEEDEGEAGYAGPLTAPAGAAPAQPSRPSASLTMVEAPTLKPPAPASSTPPPAPEQPSARSPDTPPAPPAPAAPPPGESLASEPSPPAPAAPESPKTGESAAGETPGT